MRSNLVVLIISVTLMFSGCKPDQKIVDTEAYNNRETVWTQFRETFTYHTQLIGVSDFPNDESKVIIVAEPPESITLSDFEELMKGYNAFVDVGTHEIGVDGWVKDVIISVHGVNKETLNDLIDKIHQLVYKSTYKTFYVQLPLKHKPVPFLADNVNFQISASELKKWLIDDRELFTDNTGPSGFGLKDIFDAHKTGVFYSVNNGLVLWILNRNSEIGNMDDDIRRFAVDCDLLLGAISSPSQIAIVGREREINVIDLPPLRIETIKLLAAANKTELAQSYERTSLFASKLAGGKDWAPIYLSDELLNSEYGSLLNITDQMLKGWSQNGKVQYTNFNYPSPDYWPFNQGASEDLKAPSLTFNWNTRGAVYAINDDAYDYISLNRIGSLPVSYIPEGLNNMNNKQNRVTTAEAKSYNFFSGLNNPSLIRANQYAAIYQIFSNYGIGCSMCSGSPYIESSARYFKQQTASFLSEIVQRDTSGNHRVFEAYYRQDSIFFEKSDVSKNEKMLYRAFYPYLLGKEIEKVDSIYTLLKEIQDVEGETGITTLAEYMANPRDAYQRLTDGLLTENEKEIFNRAYYFNQKIDFLKTLIDNNQQQVFDGCISHCETFAGNWIKTPTVVLSWTLMDSAMNIGGHNIDSRIVPFKTDKMLKPGQYKIIEEAGIKKILVAEGDINKITPALLRKVEDAKSIGYGSYTQTADEIVRPRTDIIPITNRTERGLNSTHFIAEKTDVGYIINGKKVESCHEMIEELKNYAMKEHPEGLKLKFTSFSSDEAKVIVKSADIKLAATGNLKQGNFFQVNSLKYDFAKITIKEMGNNVIVDIPVKQQLVTAGINGNAMTTIGTKITVRNLFGEAKQKVKDIIGRVLGRAKKEASPGSMDLFREMKKDLKNNGVNEKDIILEREDCIICKIETIHEFNPAYYQAA